MSAEAPLLVEREGDTYYTGPMEAGQNLILTDRFAFVSRPGANEYRVRLCDDPEGKSEAEWGAGPTLEEAWRFALGAHMGPVDEEYSENRLAAALGVSSGNPEPPMDEHVVLVGFEVAGNSRAEAQADLLALLGRPDGEKMIAYWIAEDDRVDGTDNDSAVFVPKGEQQTTTDRLARREPHARYVVLVGNPGAALTLYGPFEEHEDAVRFADDTFKDQSWSVDALMGTLA